MRNTKYESIKNRYKRQIIGNRELDLFGRKRDQEMEEVEKVEKGIK